MEEGGAQGEDADLLAVVEAANADASALEAAASQPPSQPPAGMHLFET